MRRSVLHVWFAFNAPFEGVCDFLYLDKLGLVTTGVGNLMEPMSAAEILPWRRPDGILATVAEIRNEWKAVKARQEWAKRGGGVFASMTKLRLRKVDIETLVRKKLLQNEEHMRDRFGRAGWNDWPANAQLAVHSMAWAMGPHGFAGFPKFCAAAKRADFAAMAAECKVAPDSGTLRLRNVENKNLLLNAARIVAECLDPETIIFGAPPDPPAAAA